MTTIADRHETGWTMCRWNLPAMILAGAIASVLAVWAQAEEARRLTDYEGGPRSSGPMLLTASGGRLFFTADDGVHGRELWVSDGTEVGTRMVKDIILGRVDVEPSVVYSHLIPIGDRVFFPVNDGVHVPQLWVSDGTEAGTRFVKNIGRYPAFAPLGDRLLFCPSHEELWVSDGTEAGTRHLSLSCFACNNHKGPNIAGIDPDTGDIVPLFHPRRDNWNEHFHWKGAVLVGRTPTGRATVDVLDINLPHRRAFREALIAEGVLPPSSA